MTRLSEVSAALLIFGLSGLGMGIAQVPAKPEPIPVGEKTRGARTTQDVLITESQKQEPLVVPAGVVWWIVTSGWAAIIGLGGIVYTRQQKDVDELKQSYSALGDKVDRHFENVMTALTARGK